MKKKAMVAAILAATTLSATTAFAATNPFKDVPKDHWAYDAVNMLAKDGVLEGYGDGNFNGDKLMNRYEMAEIVSKALEKYDTARPADKGAIKKLSREFAAELKDMDARLTAVEGDVQELKKNQSSFKWWGDARYRYFQNKNQNQVKNEKMGDGTSYNKSFYRTKKQGEIRARLGFYGEPAKNISVTGQLKVENANLARTDYNGVKRDASGQFGAVTTNHYADKSDEKFNLNRMELAWHAKNGVTLTAGRTELKLGQGLIYWENPLDGLFVRKDFNGKASLLLGAGDASTATWAPTAEYATLADFYYKVSPAVRLTATYYNAHSDSTNQVGVAESWNKGATWWNNWHNYTVQRNFRQFAYGFDAQLSNKWNLIAEGIHNSANVHRSYDGHADAIADFRPTGRNGFWTRLTYGKQDWRKGGTWKVYGEYFALGGLAIDSSGWAHHMNFAGGNGYGGAGARGFGFAIDYMLAANTNFETFWYKSKPYDSNSAGFKDYKDVIAAAITYSF